MTSILKRMEYWPTFIDKLYLNFNFIYMQIPATKVGLWGGNEGIVKDIPDAPKRLESITIISNYSIDSMEFTYIDQSGQKRVAGRWGGPGGTPHKVYEVSNGLNAQAML
jgi:hypothetical protein